MCVTGQRAEPLGGMFLSDRSDLIDAQATVNVSPHAGALTRRAIDDAQRCHRQLSKRVVQRTDNCCPGPLA
jgi:hypothetical protein